MKKVNRIMKKNIPELVREGEKKEGSSFWELVLMLAIGIPLAFFAVEQFLVAWDQDYLRDQEFIRQWKLGRLGK